MTARKNLGNRLSLLFVLFILLVTVPTHFVNADPGPYRITSKTKDIMFSARSKLFLDAQKQRALSSYYNVPRRSTIAEIPAFRPYQPNVSAKGGGSFVTTQNYSQTNTTFSYSSTVVQQRRQNRIQRTRNRSRNAISEGVETQIGNEKPAAQGSTQLAKYSSILRDAAKNKGNFGLGRATASEAMELGKTWVGKGYTVASDGKTLKSANGLRQFRPPSFKPRLGIQQANFEWRNVAKGAWQGNGHLDIIIP